MYGRLPGNIGADAGYGSLENYRFLKEKGLTSFVKHQSWEGNASGSRPECYRVVDEGKAIECLAGKRGTPCAIEGRHPKRAGASFYRIQGCKGCPFRDYCMRQMRPDPERDGRYFEVVPELALLKQESERNLLSVKGIEMRVNRSIMVEGVFGVQKQDHGYTRIRRRGIGNVAGEIYLTMLGLNVRRLFSYFATGHLPSPWKAPQGIEPEEFKKPSAKRLSRKGRRINGKIYKADREPPG